MKKMRTSVLAACLPLLAVAADAGQARADRVERLERWLAAVEQHELRTADDAAREIAAWDRPTLRLVWIDLGTVVGMIREPDIGIFFAPPEPVSSRMPQRLRGAPPRATQIAYSRAELSELRRMAREVIAGGGENRVLKRGAMLHADIAMLVPVESNALRSFRPAGPQRIMLFVSDGQPSGLEDGANHWDMGRRLLDKVRPAGSRQTSPNGAAGDETVHAWYVAVAAHLQDIEQLEPWHIERALQLFPRDPDVLFFAASHHDALSSPQFQSVMQSIDVPNDVFFDVGSEGAELRQAEQLFRKVLEVAPAANEARLRLGRVLGRRGQHDEAARELRQAVAATENALLRYYGTMFLGAELEALGKLDEAQREYERAVTLYPRAQSPRLALSALAARRGERAAALDVLGPVLNQEDSDQADDPWWSYYTVQARASDALFAELYRRIEAETGR